MPTRRNIKSFMNEQEMGTRQSSESEQPANNYSNYSKKAHEKHGGIKPNQADGKKYSSWKD